MKVNRKGVIYYSGNYTIVFRFLGEKNESYSLKNGSGRKAQVAGQNRD
jgi:hypothetical protein